MVSTKVMLRRYLKSKQRLGVTLNNNKFHSGTVVEIHPKFFVLFEKLNILNSQSYRQHKNLIIINNTDIQNISELKT